MLPLSAFVACQILRIGRTLASATPTQRFTRVMTRTSEAQRTTPRDYVSEHRSRHRTRGTSEAEHGTIAKYCDGCRCPPCRAASQVYQRQWRAARVAARAAAGYQT